MLRPDVKNIIIGLHLMTFEEIVSLSNIIVANSFFNYSSRFTHNCLHCFLLLPNFYLFEVPTCKVQKSFRGKQNMYI